MAEETPFAFVLHEETLAKLATSHAMERGRRYVAERRVHAISWVGPRLNAEVRGGETYRISIWLSNDRLGYVCSCPQGADGNFCKHCVAVAIAWIDGRKAIG